MSLVFTVAGFVATVALFALIVRNTRRGNPRNTYGGLTAQLVVALLVVVFGALSNADRWARIMVVGFGAAIAVGTVLLMALRHRFLALRRRNDQRDAMRRRAGLN